MVSYCTNLLCLVLSGPIYLTILPTKYISHLRYSISFTWVWNFCGEDIFNLWDVVGWLAEKSNSTPFIWLDQHHQPNAFHDFFTSLFVENFFIPHALEDKYYRPPMGFFAWFLQYCALALPTTSTTDRKSSGCILSHMALGTILEGYFKENIQKCISKNKLIPMLFCW